MASKEAKAMAAFKAFGDDARSVEVGGLTIENGTERIALYGEAEISRDKAGLATARRLKAIIDSAVEALEGEAALPEQLAPPAELKKVRNPLL